MADATIKQVADFFGKVDEEGGYRSLSAFSADWKALPESDKADIRKGLGDGSVTY